MFVLIRMVKQSLHDYVPHMIDFIDIAPLLWAETYNLLGLQATVEEQVG